MTVSLYRQIACALALAGASLFARPTTAATIYLSTPAGSLDSAGEAVSASAVLTTGTDSVLVTLQNLTVNPKSIGQNLSDFAFQLTTGQTSATLSSSSGQEVKVVDDGTRTLGSTVATGWELQNNISGYIHLNVLGTPEAPQHTIIGFPDVSGVYSNANDSIAKTGGPHNPFLSGIVTFSLSVPGVTADSLVSHSIFSFGTTAGDNVSGVPLPASVWGGLALMGVVGTTVARKKVKES